MIFSIALCLRNLSDEDYKPHHTESINFDKIVFDDQNVQRRLGFCLGQTCFRSLIVFLSQLFVVVSIMCSCFGLYTWPRLVTHLQTG